MVSHVQTWNAPHLVEHAFDAMAPEACREIRGGGEEAPKRVRMKDGVVMQGKDGAKYLHKNDVIWKQITEKGTLSPNR